MAEGGLSIGVLSGRIDLDDNFTATIFLSNDALEQLEKRFGGTHEGAKHMAEGMVAAEVAIEAVKEVAHLAAEALSEITIEGARVADVEQNFNRLSLTAGELGDELLGSLKKGTHDTITDFQLMQSVNDHLAAGVHLTSDQYKDLATGAFALAQAKGTEVKDAFEKINDALLTGRVRGVQYLTGKIDIAAAEDAYAKKLGTTAERLTPLEKQEAGRAIILEKVREATQRLGEQEDGLDEKVAQAAVRWQNFTEDLGKTVATSPAILQAFDDIQNILGEAFGTDKEQLIKTIVGELEGFAKASVEIVQIGVDVVKFIVDYKEFLEPLVVALGSYYAAAALAALGTEAIEKAVALLEVTATPLGAIAIAAGAIYAAFELGKWKPVSDFFEKLGLEVFYGMSSAEADVAVATHHLTEEATTAATAGHELVDAEKEIELATQDWHKVLLTIDGSIVDWAEHLLASGVSAKSVAEEYGLTDVQVKALQQDVAEAAKAANAHQKALDEQANSLRLSKKELEEFGKSWENLSSLGGTFEETLDGINPKIKDSVQYYASLGASVQELTKAFPGLTQAQAEAAVEAQKSANEIQKVWTGVFVMQAKMHGDNINDFIKLETRRYDEAIRLLELQGKATTSALEAERAKYETTIDAEIQKREEQITTSRLFYQHQADEAKAKLDLMYEHLSDFVAADVQLAQQDYNEKERLVGHWAADANEKLEAVGRGTKGLGDTTKKFGDDAVHSFDTVSEAIRAMGAGLDETKIKVRTLSGELITLEEAKKRALQGGSFDVTSANFGKALTDYITSGGYNPSGMGVQQYRDPLQLAKAGYSFEEVIRYAFNKNYQGPIPPPQGPRIPGFREGGVGDFGGGTLAMLHGKEAIVPLNSGSGAEQAFIDKANAAQDALLAAAQSFEASSTGRGGWVGPKDAQAFSDAEFALMDASDGLRSALKNWDDFQAKVLTDGIKTKEPTIAPGAFVFNLYGTPDSLYQQVKTLLMKNLKPNHQFGSS